MIAVWSCHAYTKCHLPSSIHCPVTEADVVRGIDLTMHASAIRVKTAVVEGKGWAGEQTKAETDTETETETEMGTKIDR